MAAAKPGMTSGFLSAVDSVMDERPSGANCQAYAGNAGVRSQQGSGNDRRTGFRKS